MNIFLVLLGAYMGLGGLLYFFQDQFLYHPEKQLNATPGQHGWTYESITFQTKDGEVLHGWWIPSSVERGTLLFLHGNAGNISGRIDIVKPFLQLGLSVLLFDYRGYGQSTGTPSEEGLYQDAEAAWNYLTRTQGRDPGRVVLLGRSLGGGVATWLAGRAQPAALILESTFTSVIAMARKKFPLFPVGLMAKSRYDNLRRVAHLEVPLLVIHSPTDEVVPFAHGRRLYEAAAFPKSFMEIKGAHHNGFSVTGTAYREGIGGFLAHYVDQSFSELRSK